MQSGHTERARSHTFMARLFRPARPPALVARRTSGSRAANRRRAYQFTWLAQVASALRTCRAVQADGSVRAWVWATERTHGPALTRPTGRSLVIVGSSPHAAGQSRDGSASALDTVLRRPVTSGPRRDASAAQGAVRPAETSTCGLVGKKVQSRASS